MPETPETPAFLAVVVGSTEPLLTLDEAKQHLRVDGDEEDGLITLYANAAVLSCMREVDRQLVPQGAEPVFKAAALLMLGGLYASRESLVQGQSVTVSPAVEALLWPYRIIRV